MVADILLLFDIAAAACGLYLVRGVVQLRRSPLPPGPTRLPFIGNLFDLPKEYDWLHWGKHKELYGPISSVSALGWTLIIVNDYNCAVDLLDKRSAIYSERPTLPFVQMCGWARVTPMLYQGDEHTAHRKYMRQFIGSKTALKHLHTVEEVETRKFLLNALKNPDELHKHIRTMAGAIILKVAYGYTVETKEYDPLVELVDGALDYLQLVAQPGVSLVDVMPFLKHVPTWFPGAKFQSFAEGSRKYARKLIDWPHRFVKQQINMGTEQPSFSSFLLEQNPSAEEELSNQWAAATLFIGGADTTLSPIYAFFIVMMLYPEVQDRAQAEIDSVVGPDRLPTFADRPHLPYVNAVVKELLRWNPIVPLCPPHVAAEDDTYRGYHIPKGSLVLVNNWTINSDPKNFPDPSVFQPERFLGTNPEIDPYRITFGYGRRECPGKGLADESVFLAVAMSLATIKVTKARDGAGLEIEPKYESTNGLISHPKPFPCMITARSTKAKELIVCIEDELSGSENDAAALLRLDESIE